MFVCKIVERRWREKKLEIIFFLFPFAFSSQQSRLSKTKMARQEDETVHSIALAALPADATSIISRIGGEVRAFDIFFAKRGTGLFSLTSRTSSSSPPKKKKKKKKKKVQILLLGEATHGSAEFYSTRTQVTLDLLRSGRFHAVCVEADFPDAEVVNRYVRGSSDGTSGGASSSSSPPSSSPPPNERDALSGFQSRFPKFMWRNEQVLELVRGMRDLNLSRPDRAQQCWFVGLDVYALSRAADAVVSLLERSGEPEAAQRARERYACFDRFGEDPGDYAKGVARGDPGCEGAAVSQLVEMLQREAARTEEAAARGAADAAAASASAGEDEEEGARSAAAASEDALAALCNARSVVHAEAYYRQMVLGRRSTWNLRDSAMAETVLLVKAHLEGGVLNVDDDDDEEDEQGQKAPSSSSSRPQRKTKRVIVWAHNSHLGDARATAMSRRGEHNVGQLLRQHFERRRAGDHGEVLNLGFSTYSGTVCAAARWGGPALCRGVRAGMRGSYEELLHRVWRRLQGAGFGGEKGGEGKEGEEGGEERQQLAAVAAAIRASSSPGAFLLDLRRGAPASAAAATSGSTSSSSNAMIDALAEPRLERAIGVLYVSFFFFFLEREKKRRGKTREEKKLIFHFNPKQTKNRSRDPSATRTTLRPKSRNSLTSWSTSTRPPRSRRSTLTRKGTRWSAGGRG